MDAHDATLEQCMAALCGVRMNVTPDVFFRGMAHRFVPILERLADSLVDWIVVTDDSRLTVYFLDNRSLEGAARHVSYDESPNIPHVE
jgi:hypothetical protein